MWLATLRKAFSQVSTYISDCFQELLILASKMYLWLFRMMLYYAQIRGKYWIGWIRRAYIGLCELQCNCKVSVKCLSWFMAVHVTLPIKGSYKHRFMPFLFINLWRTIYWQHPCISFVSRCSVIVICLKNAKAFIVMFRGLFGLALWGNV
jgi:hypothetical protein